MHVAQRLRGPAAAGGVFIVDHLGADDVVRALDMSEWQADLELCLHRRKKDQIRLHSARRPPSLGVEYMS